MTIRTHKAQSIAEYAVLIGLVTMVIVGLHTSLKRSLQAHIKNTSDEFALQEDYAQKKYEYFDQEQRSSFAITSNTGSNFNRVDSTGNLSSYEQNLGLAYQQDQYTTRTPGF